MPEPTATAAPVLRKVDDPDAEQKNLRRETYFDAAGNPTVGEEGFVTRLRTLNDKGKVLSEEWLDADNQVIPIGGDTYYRVEYTYDKAGNINRERYFDAEGNLVRNRRGFAILYREYDSYNRVIYEKFFDTNSFAVMIPEGAVSYRYTYDEDGNMISVTAYDYYDHPIPANEPAQNP